MNDCYEKLYHAISQNNNPMQEEKHPTKGFGISYFYRGIKGTKFDDGSIEFCDLKSGSFTYIRLSDEKVEHIFNNFSKYFKYRI